jgi:hypothetical protein
MYRGQVMLDKIEIHTAEPFVPELKKYKSPGSDQISAELIQAGGRGEYCILR